MIINELLIATTIASSTALVVVALKLKAAKEETVSVLNKNIIFLDESINWSEKANEYQDKWLEATEELADIGKTLAEVEHLAMQRDLDLAVFESENKQLRKSLEEISSKKYFEMGRYPAPYIAPVPPWSIAERALAK